MSRRSLYPEVFGPLICRVMITRWAKPLGCFRHSSIAVPKTHLAGRVMKQVTLPCQAVDPKIDLLFLACLIIRAGENQNHYLANLSQYETWVLDHSVIKRSDKLTSASLGFSSDFFIGIMTVVLIDIVLAGDNAVVIAMAAKSLPQDKRRLAIIFGAGLAVVLRIALTVFAAQLLQISLVKLVGGVLIIWIGVKLLVVDDSREATTQAPGTLWTAVWIIIVADVTMSMDNVLALAGASKGDPFLLLFGLILSIPLVVGASGLLSNLMDRYPVIIYLGAAVLGKVGAELIMGDPLVADRFHPSTAVEYLVQACFAVGVIVAARIIRMYFKGKGPERIETPEAP